MDLAEDKRNFWRLVILLLRVGKPKIRQFFIDHWNAVKGYKCWTDCKENGRDLLQLYTNPLAHELDAIKSGNTLKWSLPLVIKVILHLERQLFVKKSRIRALKYLFELREELHPELEAVIRKDVFEKKWDVACTALTLFGATSRDFKETKKVRCFLCELASHQEDFPDLSQLVDHGSLEHHCFQPESARPDRHYPIRTQGLTEQPLVIQKGERRLRCISKGHGSAQLLFPLYSNEQPEALDQRPRGKPVQKENIKSFSPYIAYDNSDEDEEPLSVQEASYYIHAQPPMVPLPYEKTGKNEYMFRITTPSFRRKYFELPNHGIFLDVQPYTVSTSFSYDNLMECRVVPDAVLPSPAGTNETIVSDLVELKLAISKVSKVGKVPVIVTLPHSGADKSFGYETIIKAFDEGQKLWHEVEEYVSRGPGYPYKKTNSIRVLVDLPTTLAVVTRVIVDRFQVTPKGCVVRSSVCHDVTVEFPEGAVDKTVEGTIKLILMPESIHHTKDACPILCVDGFSNSTFSKPVIVKMPIPNNAAEYSTNGIRLLRLEDNKWEENKWEENKWEDVTDQANIVKFKTHIEFYSTHFSCLWPWMSKTKIKFASTIFRYLRSPPRAVCFAAFKDNEEARLSVQKLTLVCVANHKQYETVSNMRGEGCSKLAVETGDRKMRPNDKAYLRINGADMRNESFFLRFLEDEVCRKELSVRDTGQDQESHEELVLNFFPNTEEISTLLLATLRISKDVVFLGRGRDRQRFPMSSASQLEVEEEAQVLEGAVANPLLLSPQDQEEEEDGGIRDLVPHFDQASLATISAEEVAERLPQYLDVDRTSIIDPPQEIMEKCRKFSRLLKKTGKTDIVEALRTTLPSGMSGPLLDGNILVKNLDYSRKLKLSRALSVKEEWRIFAEKIDGLTNIDIDFYAVKKDNPVLEILTHYCADMKIDTLYRLLVESGANAIADQCL